LKIRFACRLSASRHHRRNSIQPKANNNRTEIEQASERQNPVRPVEVNAEGLDTA